LSTAKALPTITDAIGNDLVVFVDSGVRSGLDVVRMLALGARGVMLGRAPAFAPAASGQAGIENLLDILPNEMRVSRLPDKFCADDFPRLGCDARLSRVRGRR